MAKKINEAFFDKWTQESSYIFGYIYADGCLTKYKERYSVSVSSRELDIIETIRLAMDSDLAITEHKGQYSFSFGRLHLIERLKEMGLIERKSKLKTFPTSVPREFLPHFIRGYFDGNGYFTYENHKPGKKRMKAGFSFGSPVFGEELLDVLRELGIQGGTLMKHKKTATSFGESLEVRLYTRDTKRLYEMMYENASIYLERKKEYYDGKIGS